METEDAGARGHKEISYVKRDVPQALLHRRIDVERLLQFIAHNVGDVAPIGRRIRCYAVPARGASGSLELVDAAHRGGPEEKRLSSAGRGGLNNIRKHVRMVNRKRDRGEIQREPGKLVQRHECGPFNHRLARQHHVVVARVVRPQMSAGLPRVKDPEFLYDYKCNGDRLAGAVGDIFAATVVPKWNLH